MPKLTRKQLSQIRRQAKESREKSLEKELTQADGEAESQPEAQEKKDKMGLTRTQRENISKIKGTLDQVKQKITWSYNPGDLVHLPSGEIGMIVENNAVDLEIRYSTYDAKKTLSNNRYEGQVFVVTSSGNNWYYPNQLKIIK